MRFLIVQNVVSSDEPYGRFSAGMYLILEKFGLHDFCEVDWQRREEWSSRSGPYVVLVPAGVTRSLSPGDLQWITEQQGIWFLEGPWGESANSWFGFACESYDPPLSSSCASICDNSLRQWLNGYLAGIHGPSNSGAYESPDTLWIRDRVRVERRQTEILSLHQCNQRAKDPSWKLSRTKTQLPVDTTALIREADNYGRSVLLFRKANLVVSTFELFSYLVQDYTAETMHHEYAFSNDRYPWEILLVHYMLSSLQQQLLDQAQAGGVLRDLAAIRIAPWPYGKQYAVTVRHDVDRIPKDPSFPRLLEIGRQATVGVYSCFLASTANAKTITQFEKNNAEIAYHSMHLEPEARTEINAIEKHSSKPMRGFFVHGNPGFYGWRGAANWEIAQELGFEYCENLSSMRYFPGRAFKLDDNGSLKAYPFVCLPHHISFDKNKTVNRANEITRSVQVIARNQMHLILMNHPDLHNQAFMQFLTENLPEDYIGWTALEVSRWWRKTHFSENLQYEVSWENRWRAEIVLRTDEPIPGLTLEIPAAVLPEKIEMDGQPLLPEQIRPFDTSALCSRGWRIWFDIPAGGARVVFEIPEESV